ncbi:hypothetical protein B0H12DRAFT_1230049 [Mycena haematopus]|nr:hypothetical protein B0H12DRAFT_1230049 [Mycena haematopus]
MIIEYTDHVQEHIRTDMLSKTPTPECLVIGLLWGAGSQEPSFVPVPPCQPSAVPTSPDDLDTSWWIPSGLGAASGIVDLSVTRLKITHWPFESMEPLPHPFTPLNDHFGSESEGSMNPFRGNVLVIKHGVNNGLANMNSEDLNLATAIVKRLVEERLVGCPRL